MNIIRPELTNEIHDLIMDDLSPEAELRRVHDPGDIGVWQNQNGKIVNYYYADPNNEVDIVNAGLGILSVDEDGKRHLLQDWSITRWSAEESLTGYPEVEVTYRNPDRRTGAYRVSKNPERT